MQSENEEILQFLYQSPIGLVQATLAGDVGMMTPKAAQLLMTFTGKGEISNIFDALSVAAPELRNLVQSFDKKRGVVIERRRCPVVDTAGRTQIVLEVAVNKIAKDRIVVQIDNVTELVRFESQAMLHAHMMEAIVENICDQRVCIIDSAGRVVSWNGSGTRLHGFDAGEIVGQPFEAIAPLPTEIGATNAQDWSQFLAGIAKAGAARVQGLHRRKDGTTFWAESVITPLQDTFFAREEFLVVSRDITAEHDRTVELEQRASTDPLTGSLNRRAFFDIANAQLDTITASGDGYCIGLLDIDHFKKLNDTYGHAVGDRALKVLVEVCGGQLRKSDLICRFGGEEFLLFMPGTDLGVATGVAERLRHAISAIELFHDGQAVHFTASIGVAEWRPGEGMQKTIESADAALYAAKHGGRNRVEAATNAA